MTGAPPTLAPPRPDASMTLLTSVIERPLDPGYAAAAARRSAAGLPPATPLRGPLILGAGLVAGLVLSVSAMTLRAGETDEARVRTDLITQIQDRRGVADERATQVGKLQAEVAELEDAALGDAALGGLATRLASLRTQVGAEALRGPGMVISLNDRPTTADGVPADAEGKVLSRDVFIVVNGLWEAGAEAIAINGQRLTTRSAIRFAGDAILVNFRPLVPPYVITAIGDPATMPGEFGEGVGAAYVKSLSDNYGLVTDIKTATEVIVPSASSLKVAFARPASAVTP